jgi:hypothetical protein
MLNLVVRKETARLWKVKWYDHLRRFQTTNVRTRLNVTQCAHFLGCWSSCRVLSELQNLCIVRYVAEELCKLFDYFLIFPKIMTLCHKNSYFQILSSSQLCTVSHSLPNPAYLDCCSVSQQLGALQTHTTDTFLLISHTTNVPLFKCRCNIFIGVSIIKEVPGSVASGTHCISRRENLEPRSEEVLYPNFHENIAYFNIYYG